MHYLHCIVSLAAEQYSQWVHYSKWIDHLPLLMFRLQYTINNGLTMYDLTTVVHYSQLVDHLLLALALTAVHYSEWSIMFRLLVF